MAEGFMERWVRRLKGEAKPLESYAEWQREYDAALAEARADTPALPKVKVEPFSAKPKCPKCGGLGISTEYQSGVHRDCPHLYMFDPQPLYELSIWGRPSPRVVVARERTRDAAVEHLDRRCCNCQYGWTEATVASKKSKRRSSPTTPAATEKPE